MAVQSTETSSSFIPLILHEEIQEILPVLILHAEGKEIFYPVYKDLQGIPGIPAARPSTGIPVLQGHSSHSRHSSSTRTFQSFQTFQSFMTFQPSSHYYTSQYFQYITVFPVHPGIPPTTALQHSPVRIQIQHTDWFPPECQRAQGTMHNFPVVSS